MSNHLIERSLVKDLINVPRADTLWDSVLNSLIEQASDDVRRFTRREFDKIIRTEFLTSFEQSAYDPDPQYLWLLGVPIDTGQAITVVWDAYDRHDTSGITLTEADGDYFVDAPRGLIVVRQASNVSQELLVAGSIAGPLFTYNPRGFKVTYTGGFALSVQGTPPPTIDPDPIEDFGIPAIPNGLKMVMARKIATDWTAEQKLMPWSEDEQKALVVYAKKDQLY